MSEINSSCSLTPSLFMAVKCHTFYPSPCHLNVIFCQRSDQHGRDSGVMYSMSLTDVKISSSIG
ncbi:hypothetical protein BgiBS90_012337, partial [Biomphalaria glabrata]